jgi:hypothetical protein
MYRQIDDERKRLQAEVERLREQHESYMSKMNDGWFEMEQERDQLKAELERYSMNAGAADQFRREAFAMRQALGFDKYGDDIAPVDLLNALDSHDAEAIERAREYVTSIVEESDFAVDYDLALLEYGKKLRQRAKEVQS